MSRQPDPLDDRVVSHGWIARRLGVQRETVKMWRRRELGFPEPLPNADGPVFDWEEVRAWAKATGRLPEGE